MCPEGPDGRGGNRIIRFYVAVSAEATSRVTVAHRNAIVWRGSRQHRLTATQSDVAAIRAALGLEHAGNFAAGSAFLWRTQNALPAVDRQHRGLQVDSPGVAVDTGSRVKAKNVKY
jgi:hypothetical protein